MDYTRSKKERRREGERGKMGIKKGLEEKREAVEEEELMREIIWKSENWKVRTVYIRDNMEKKIRKKVDEKRRKRVDNSDFNARRRSVRGWRREDKTEVIR